MCEATHTGHLASPPLVSAGGSRWREVLGSHLGMTDPVPSSASPGLNNGWVPQCFGQSTARQQGRGSHHLGSRKVTSVAVYGAPLVGKRKVLPYATRLCRRCHPASPHALPARPSPAAAHPASSRGAERQTAGDPCGQSGDQSEWPIQNYHPRACRAGCAPSVLSAGASGRRVHLSERSVRFPPDPLKGMGAQRD